MIIAQETYLEHFGKKGMRWGVVKEDKSSGEKSTKTETSSGRSNFRERNLKVNTNRYNTLNARAAKSNVRISEINTELKTLPKYSGKARNLRYERQMTTKQRDIDLKKAAKPPSDGLTPTQKKLLIGAGVATVMVGLSIASKRYDAEGMGAAMRRKASKLEYGDVFRPNKSFAKKMSPDDVLANVVKGINPKYNTQGGTMNCRRTTFAYEMRRRGYDVTATLAPMGYGQNESGLVNALIKGDRNKLSGESMSAFAGNSGAVDGIRTRAVKGDKRQYTADTETVTDISKLRAALSRHPNGARGEAVFDVGPFAHSMQWEVFDGVPHIFDSQKAARYDTDDKGLRKLTEKWGSPKRMDITRLDNVDLDTDFISRWVTDVKPKAAEVRATAAQTRREKEIKRDRAEYEKYSRAFFAENERLAAERNRFP